MIPAKILKMASEHFHVAPELLKSRGRWDELVRARSIAALAMREHLKMSYWAIGRYLNKDHTTIMEAVKRAKRWRDDPARFRENLAMSEIRAMFDAYNAQEV